jgi:GT2 family glycosyltransferase
MSEIPDRVRRLAGQRQAAREAGDFALADAIRVAIHDAGFDVVDTPTGPALRPRVRAAGSQNPQGDGEIVSLLDQPPSCDVSVHWIVEGWPEDVVRGIEGFARHAGGASIHHVVVDLTDAPPDTWPPDVDVVAVPVDAGWAGGRNAGLRRAAGRIVLLADGCVEPTGDVLTPLVDALGDPSVGVAGPFGIVTDDLREFRDSPGPDVDAIEGYLMALRRELFVRGLRFDPKFRFYRTADVELSFQVKALGLRAVVTPVPVARHDHRMWANTAPDRRTALSKRNFYRFLDRWRGRFDLTVAGAREA